MKTYKGLLDEMATSGDTAMMRRQTDAEKKQKRDKYRNTQQAIGKLRKTIQKDSEKETEAKRSRGVAADKAFAQKGSKERNNRQAIFRRNDMDRQRSLAGRKVVRDEIKNTGKVDKSILGRAKRSVKTEIGAQKQELKDKWKANKVKTVKQVAGAVGNTVKNALQPKGKQEISSTSGGNSSEPGVRYQ